MKGATLVEILILVAILGGALISIAVCVAGGMFAYKAYQWIPDPPAQTQEVQPETQPPPKVPK